MTGQPRVLVLGYGEMGHASEFLLKQRVRLDIWEKFPSPGFTSVVLEDSAPRADVILFCLPVNPHREVAGRIAPLIRKDCICISIAKGLDESGQTAAQIFADVFSAGQPRAFMYGPMISEEIRAGRYAFAQVGSLGPDTCRQVQALFRGTRLYLQPTSDITGISWSVILKNVYAMIFGMADELGLGDNMRGYLAATSLRELDSIVRGMGGEAGSPYQLAGLADLMTTATSKDSHHHELGCRLARGETENISGEGVHTLAMVYKHHLFDPAQYPLFTLIHDIFDDPRDIAARIDAFLARQFD